MARKFKLRDLFNRNRNIARPKSKERKGFFNSRDLARPQKKSFIQRARSLFRGGEVRSFAREAEKRESKFTKKLGIPKGASNSWIKVQINNATNNKASAFSESTVRSFWSLTRDIWNKDDVAIEDRLDVIMDYFGTKNVGEAMARAFAMVDKIYLDEMGKGLDIYKYSINGIFGVGFFSTG